MSDTNLTQKFSALQTQLGQQHTQIMDVLNLIRQDCDSIKASAAATATHTGNVETFTLQIAQSNVDIYNRLQTLNTLYDYLSRDADQGLDLMSRINYLQARANELNGYVDGLEGLITPMGQQLTDMLDQLTRVRVSVAPNTASSVYTRLNALTGYVNVMYLAMTGNVGTWTGETLMAYLADIKAAGVQDVSANESNGQTLGDILTAVSGLASCVCTPEPNICDSGVALPTRMITSSGPQTLSIIKIETTDIIDTGYPIVSDSFFDPVNAGGRTESQMQWSGTEPAITPVGVAEWCVRNGTTATQVHVGILDATTDNPSFVRLPVGPGETLHFGGYGPATYLALWVNTIPTGQESSIEIISFGVG